MTPRAGVARGEAVERELLGGVRQMARLLVRTFGPRAGGVLYQVDEQPPEVVTSGATIARRIIELDGRNRNIGSLLLRHAAWAVHERVGDGSVTTAVQASDMIGAAYRARAAGFDPVAVRAGMEQACAVAIAELGKGVRPAADAPTLAQVLTAATGEPGISRSVAAVFAAAGADAHLDIEDYAKDHVAHRLLPGARLRGEVLRGPARSAASAAEPDVVAEPYLLITDQVVESAAEALPIMERVLAEGGGPLVLVAPEFGAEARAAIRGAHDSGVLEVYALRLTEPESADELLEDLAASTSARLLRGITGDRLSAATLQDLGYARVLRSADGDVDIVGGSPDETSVEERVAGLRGALTRLAGDADRRRMLHRRLANLTGSYAVLELGAESERQRVRLKDAAERAVRLARVAYSGGAVAGGGAALLACQPALRALEGASAGERIGISIVHDALAAPMRELIRTTGRDPQMVMSEDRRSGAGYDVVHERFCDLWDEGVVDALEVVQGSLAAAVSLAGSVVTTEAVVMRSRPEVALTP